MRLRDSPRRVLPRARRNVHIGAVAVHVAPDTLAQENER